MNSFIYDIPTKVYFGWAIWGMLLCRLIKTML